MALRDAKGVRVYTRNGNDFSKRFPLIMAAVATLPARSRLIDGEAIVSNEAGLAVFNLMRRSVPPLTPGAWQRDLRRHRKTHPRPAADKPLLVLTERHPLGSHNTST
jgi:hypothetical protein